MADVPTIPARLRRIFGKFASIGPDGPPRVAPFNELQYAIRKNLCVSDFDLRVRVARTGGSKSMMIAFGYQDTHPSAMQALAEEIDQGEAVENDDGQRCASKGKNPATGARTAE